MTQRTDRIDELLRQEISELLAREIADPRIGFATVTDVETAADLSHARVWVSVIGQPAERALTVKALERAMPFIRHELGKRLRIRRIPEFSVRLDESIERGSRVMQLINELEAGAIPDELPPGESLPTPGARLPQSGDTPEMPEGAGFGRPTQKPGRADSANRRQMDRKPTPPRRGANGPKGSDGRHAAGPGTGSARPTGKRPARGR